MKNRAIGEANRARLSWDGAEKLPRSSSQFQDKRMWPHKSERQKCWDYSVRFLSLDVRRRCLNRGAERGRCLLSPGDFVYVGIKDVVS